ncbi:MAG: class I SAM-dependent methyltransferase [Chloroflexi bacterium]|nr:class I SAM-dependent methyltransferase [Chloroflexota bacterium]
MSSSEQFGKTAQAYLTSATHARGPDLRVLAELADPRGTELLLDVGTNVGHTLRALASRVRYAVGSDVAGQALRLNRATTEEPNVSFVEADAAALPFADAAFDLVTCRLAAHHFPDPERAFGEMCRVVARDGRLLLIDNYVPEDAALEAWINEIEWLRDDSHVRERTLGQELALIRAAGLEPEVHGHWDTPLETEDWLARSQTPPDRAERVRALLRGAGPREREAFAVGPGGGSFVVRKSLISARRA